MAMVHGDTRLEQAESGWGRPPDRRIWWIAGSGVVPFVILAALVGFAEGRVVDQARFAMAAYGAVVLGFLGGARWGAELVRAPGGPSLLRLVAAAVPTVVAWGAMLLEPRVALGVLILAGAVQLAWDLVAAGSGLLPRWTRPVRTVLTGVGVAAMAVGAV